MPNNLDIGIRVQTDKLRADMAVVKTELDKATKLLETYRKEAAKTGDTSKVKEQAIAVQALNREYMTGTTVLRTYNRAMAEHGAAAYAAARGLKALNAGHKEMAEKGEVNVREITKISKELGGLETSGFAVAKMFKEFPKVAVPVAIAAGVAEAGKKLADAAHDNITALDNLSKSSGFARAQILGLKGTFAAADVPVTNLEKTLRSIGETFDKAKVKATDFSGAMSNVNVGRGPGRGIYSGHGPASGDWGTEGHGPGSRPTQMGITPGVSDYQAPPPGGVYPTEDVPGTPSRAVGVSGRGAGVDASGVFVGGGGAPLAIDPSKGFAGLLDPSRFKDAEAYFAALQRLLKTINQTFPAMTRELLRAQGLDQDDLRGILGSTADEFRKQRESALTAPEIQPGALPLARQFGAVTREAGERTERTLTTAGIPAMEAAVPIMQDVANAADKLSESLQKTREDAAATMDALTKGPDSGELGASTEAFSSAWINSFAAIGDAWSSLRDSISANPLPTPMGTGTIPPAAPTEGAGVYATGGIVGGVGSGDTVPAWLTPGEFVNRRASVAYYGAGLFSALNSRAIPRDLFSRLGFAVGGLVGDGAAHFAEGGLAVAPSGAPIHLHLDGQSFATTATESVASALVATARRQQMRSAGVKPSWYGGRAGG